MQRIIRIVIIGVVALTLLTGLAPGILAQGTPSGGQVFSTVPQAVEQQIDPSIDPQTVQVIVIAPNGARADDGVTRTTAPGVRSTILRPGLGDGDYLVYWISGDAGKRAAQFGEDSFSVSGSTRNEGGDRFLDFIEQELLPAVDRQFRGGLPRTFIGHSSGGILATYAAATRSTYRAVVAIDTPTHLDDEWLVKKLLARAKTAPTPLRYVSLEARFGWTDETWKTLMASAPANWKLYRESFKPKETHESMVMLSMYIGLREAFSDYSMLAAPIAPTTSILPYYAKVSASLGATVIPPRKLILNVVEDLLIEGRGAAARGRPCA